MRALATADARSTERDHTADQLADLSRVVAQRDTALAELIGRLGIAVREDRREDVQGYAGAIDPRGLAELLVFSRSPVWGFIEVARNVLVFAPIAVTWYGLSIATDAYATLLGRNPDLVTRPFLLLWQEGFEGLVGFLKFSTLAIIDASLIGLLIVLSLLIHFRIDVRDVAMRTKVLLKESEIRGLLAHTLSLSTADADLPDPALLDQMVAEERRIYERAMEREQRLFDMEGAVADLRRAASELARAAEALGGERAPKR
ncbi:MAG TPA: hypothetical protein VFC31_02080 [Candidatus Limnocylindria bacterium]|nr:hypothetical protein [Candidatus Limnocylindria bacterium]